MKPLVLINFKTYEIAIGKKALELARIVEKVAKEKDANLAIAVEAPSLYIAKEISIPVFAQHVDPAVYGKYTGHILPETVKELGVYGTLLNHSEKRLDGLDIKRHVDRCKSVGLKTMVCVQDLEEAKKVLFYSPDYMALEERDLIGSGESISRAEPEKIREFVKLFDGVVDTIPICGAGVSTGEDVKAALELGTRGVILASAVGKAADPETVLRDLVSA